MRIDFTVPVIDNFGDMGFALSLALSMTSRNPDVSVRFYSEDRELFEKMLGHENPQRIEYCALRDWKGETSSELRFNFFAYPLRENDLERAKNLRKILNFDYLQFHKWAGPNDPGIISLHGTKYEIGGKDITYLVPSPIPEWAGVVIPNARLEWSKEDFMNFLGEDKKNTKKWCSVFVYPHTAKVVEQAARKYPEWTFFVCWGGEITGENIVNVPFLPLQKYNWLLELCDANIVRWENSLVSAMLTGKPFLWDIYRERNGAHKEKMRDLWMFVDTYHAWGETLAGFLTETQERSIDLLLNAKTSDFSKLGKELAEHDIVKTIERNI